MIPSFGRRGGDGSPSRCPACGEHPLYEGKCTACRGSAKRIEQLEAQLVDLNKNRELLAGLVHEFQDACEWKTQLLQDAHLVMSKVQP